MNAHEERLNWKASSTGNNDWQSLINIGNKQAQYRICKTEMNNTIASKKITWYINYQLQNRNFILSHKLVDQLSAINLLELNILRFANFSAYPNKNPAVDDIHWFSESKRRWETLTNT